MEEEFQNGKMVANMKTSGGTICNMERVLIILKIIKNIKALGEMVRNMA